MKAVYLPQLADLAIPSIPSDWARFWPRTDVALTPKIRRLLWEIRCLPGHKFDSVAALSGAERIGKTSLASHMAELLDPGFGVGAISFKGHPFIEIGRKLRPGNARLWDEGPFTKDAMTRENKDADEHLFKCGQLYLHNFVIKPNLRWMGAVVSQHRAALWFLVVARGKCIVHGFKRADYPGAKPGWHKLFGFDYPDYNAPWKAEYEAMKFADLYPSEGPGSVAVWPVPDSGKVAWLANEFRRLHPPG